MLCSIDEVKREQVITLQMAQQLETKNIVVPGQLFCRQLNLNFCQRKTHCIDDQDKFQSVTDTDNDKEFTECQTPRKKLHAIGISTVS